MEDARQRGWGRPGEEKFNLETLSSKLPKEVHAPCIHRRAGSRRGRREAERLGRFFTRDEVPSSRRPKTKPTPPPDMNSERKLGPLILSIAPSQDLFPNYENRLNTFPHSIRYAPPAGQQI